MSENKIYNLGELFCGPGGIAQGAMSVSIPGVKIVHQWANDFDQDTCNTYIHNICPDNPESVYCEDIRSLDFSKLEPINALAFGFPCNDFSVVGKKKGLNGNYGPLYSYGKKALDLFNPDWFLAENVKGLQSDNGGKTLNKILKEFSKSGKDGYNIYPNLYHFEDYGIPQTRHRIIIVGIKKSLPFEFKIPSTKSYQQISCKSAIEEPPIPDDAPNNKRTKMYDRVIERLTYIKPGQNAFTADIPPRLQLHVKGATLSQIYKRLDPSKPSYTVTGSGGGGTHMYHWEDSRALTNREKARLQTFPDNYYFYGDETKVRRQIGMAVPCKGAQIIIEALLKTLMGIPYESQPSNMFFDNSNT